MAETVRKSIVVSAPLLSAVAIMLSGCGSPSPSVPVHLNASGECINENTGQIVEQRICYGYQGGHYGGSHFIYIPYRSAPYYASPGSRGYVKPWSSGSIGSSRSFSGAGTVRGFFGGSAGGLS